MDDGGFALSWRVEVGCGVPVAPALSILTDAKVLVQVVETTGPSFLLSADRIQVIRGRRNGGDPIRVFRPFRPI